MIDLLPTEPSTYTARPGGSPANTAVALARLGSEVLLLARLSGDVFGQQLREHLARNGVDLSLAIRAAEPSGVAVVTRDAAGSASYRFALDGAADWQWTPQELGDLPSSVVAVHAGSLTLGRAPGATVVERWLAKQRAGCTISIDPNLRPGLMPSVDVAREQVARWLALADVFKASTEDVQLLHPGGDPVEVAQSWSTAGPALIVLTAGAKGVIAVSRGAVLRLPAESVEVVDTVGAGDTFTAGLLHALAKTGRLGGRLVGLDEAVVLTALRYASRAAGITCSRVGADPPTAAEVAG